MDAKMQLRRTLELDLRQCGGGGRVRAVLPADRSSSRPTRSPSFEALLRWHHPQRGLVAAGRVRAAGRGDRPDQPDRRLGAEAGLPRGDELAGPSTVAVNLSPVQFKSGTLVLDVMAALGQSGLPPPRLELEITETVLLQDTEDTVDTLNQLARARRAHRDGRFRHRLFQPRLSAQVSVRQDQDRPLLHPRPGREAGFDRDRPRRHRAWQQRSACRPPPRAWRPRSSFSSSRDEGCTEVQGFLFSEARPASELPRPCSHAGCPPGVRKPVALAISRVAVGAAYLGQP